MYAIRSYYVGHLTPIGDASNVGVLDLQSFQQRGQAIQAQSIAEVAVDFLEQIKCRDFAQVLGCIPREHAIIEPFVVESDNELKLLHVLDKAVDLVLKVGDTISYNFV